MWYENSYGILKLWFRQEKSTKEEMIGLQKTTSVFSKEEKFLVIYSQSVPRKAGPAWIAKETTFVFSVFPFFLNANFGCLQWSTLSGLYVSFPFPLAPSCSGVPPCLPSHATEWSLLPSPPYTKNFMLAGKISDDWGNGSNIVVMCKILLGAGMWVLGKVTWLGKRGNVGWALSWSPHLILRLSQTILSQPT